jgi:L-threonylcarbamoyladenylate synthase
MSPSPDHHQTPCLAVSDGAIGRAAGVLRDGGLVAFPTETVYGLGGDACNAEAVAAIFAAKGRPSFNPLISHLASARDAFDFGVESRLAAALAKAFWPGPMTLILDRVADCPIARLTSAGLDQIALRVPAHPAANRLLQAFDGPVAAPSANPSGRISPSRAEHVIAGLDGRIAMVLDGGRCESGVESTVIDCTADVARILRPGGITRRQVFDCLAAEGLRLADTPPPGSSDAPLSPGLLASHYAPAAQLRMNVTAASPGMELIGFGGVAGSGDLALNLSPAGDLAEAAANLFDMLHAADASGTAMIAVAPVPTDGLGEAINDRLRRAAAPRT